MQMQSNRSGDGPPGARHAGIRASAGILALSVGVVAFFLAFQNAGLLPTVFADEYTYSKLSRLISLDASPIPSYLYLGLYRATNHCGDGFLECARLLNAAAFSLAIPFVYLSGRTVANRAHSLVLTLLAIAGPINTYSAYFMPESLYFLSVWIFYWSFIRLTTASSPRNWFAAGLAYGASSLVKVHSLFFLPAILVYIGFLYVRNKTLFSRGFLISNAALLIGASLVKFLGGYLLAGIDGITAFGPFYGSHAPTDGQYRELISIALTSFRGHTLALALIYGVPLAVAALTLLRFPSGGADSDGSGSTGGARYSNVTVFTLLVILNLVCVAALFTASVVNAGPYETPHRLHLRYYNFALPLLYIIAAGALSRTKLGNQRVLRYLIGGAVALVAFYAIYTNLSPYTPSFIDSPEVRGIHASALGFRIIGGLLLLSLVVWMVSERIGLQVYLFLALPLFVITSYYHVSSEQRNRLVADVYDKAGLFTKQYLPKDDISSVVIVGSEPAGLFRTLFYLDDPNAQLKVVPDKAELVLHELRSENDWALVVGERALPDPVVFKIEMDGFTLAKLTQTDSVDFRKSVWPGLISKTHGLSAAESWGTWSDSSLVDLSFSAPLPEEFEIHLDAHAFGPNVGQEFTATVGSQSAKFSLSGSTETVTLAFDNPARVSSLRIMVPRPISPKDLGVSADNRKLGIGLVELKIISNDNAHGDSVDIKQ